MLLMLCKKCFATNYFIHLSLCCCSFDDDALSFSSSNRRNSMTTFRRTQLVMSSIARASACCVKGVWVSCCVHRGNRERDVPMLSTYRTCYRDKQKGSFSVKNHKRERYKRTDFFLRHYLTIAAKYRDHWTMQRHHQ